MDIGGETMNIDQEENDETQENPEYEKEYQEQYGGNDGFNVMRIIRRYSRFITPSDTILIHPAGKGKNVNRLLKKGFYAHGADISQYAADNCDAENGIIVDDITDTKINTSYDLIICRYLFEHFTMEQIEKALLSLSKLSHKYIYIGVTLKTNKNFQNDPTHIALYTYSEWQKIILKTGYFTLLEARRSYEEWFLVSKKYKYTGPDLMEPFIWFDRLSLEEKIALYRKQNNFQSRLF